ncbi:MAG TPA: TetR/AcrR family transcriptional regulator [Clostridia bacterium]
MDKKQIQHQRMTGYFLDAACKIIKEQGLKELTVRKVADEAGYHYSTIYNYFKDINDLIVQVTIRFFNECNEYIQAYTSLYSDVFEKYLKSWEGFLGYSLDNPAIFRCMFIENFGDEILSDVSSKLEELPLFVNKREALEKCVQNGSISGKKAQEIENILISLCVGIVTLYINKRIRFSKETALNNFRNNMLFIIENSK